MSDATEFTIFMSTYQDSIHAFVVRLTGDVSRAREITQEVFVEAYLKFETVRCHPSPEGWLKKAARNKTANLFTRYLNRLASFPKLRRSSDGDDVDIDIRVSESILDGLETVELQEIVEKAVMALPKNQREPLVLCEYEDMSYVEIARHLGKSVNAVKGAIKRARESLRQSLEGYQP